MQVFLKYLYTGKIQVDYANVIPILQLADKYNVKDLLRLAEVFLLTATNFVSWQSWTGLHVSERCPGGQEEPG